ncbi:N-acetylmuramoyl-L-alanine amidase CwlD [Jeotgalibacillus proteolyticus]|uniref:N-acetylmuramoyl-L-alanine amidase CwlD n=1 Tax=Jeotgalibacillus proteolyticus TaxID=2082395 RepID=A0A2S5G6M5_9BACL|nr:N-acetylmuramoyl-L-alanine amidase CwlD [Jeotgalibacillus proteolyticus]PPA68639.1 N-acetylmuramoyl-L-alanine amidase CwlD [Jeotgalibacillus proteolyticus]
MKKKIISLVVMIAVAAVVLGLRVDRVVVNTIQEWRMPLAGKVIVIDPGHGGADGGASYETILEKNLTLTISRQLQAYLEEQGAIVKLTREKDMDLADEATKGYRNRKREDLKHRLDLLNDKDNDLFISIHLNAIPQTQWSGAQTFYTNYHDDNERIARFVQHELVRHLPKNDRRAKPIDGIYVLSHAKTPGILVEAGFLSNPEERYWLLQDEYQQSVAASIYLGILRHYSDEETIVEEY